MGISGRFDVAFRKLLRVFGRYTAHPRSPESVAELGARRIDLENARSEMTAIRREEGLAPTERRESPRQIEPGHDHAATGFEKAAVLVVLLIVLGGPVLIVWAYRSADPDRIELRDGTVKETLEPTGTGSCIWTVTFELNALVPNANIRDAAIDISPAATPRDDFKQLPTTSNIRGPSRLGYEFDTCPTSVDDIGHGPLNITYVAGSTKIRTAELDW